MQVKLVNGRNDKNEDTDGKGFDGPVFKDVKMVQSIYTTRIHIHFKDEDLDCRTMGFPDSNMGVLEREGDLIVHEGKYYSDIFVLG